jgi:hypothetical protein
MPPKRKGGKYPAYPLPPKKRRDLDPEPEPSTSQQPSGPRQQQAQEDTQVPFQHETTTQAIMSAFSQAKMMQFPEPVPTQANVPFPQPVPTQAQVPIPQPVPTQAQVPFSEPVPTQAQVPFHQPVPTQSTFTQALKSAPTQPTPSTSAEQPTPGPSSKYFKCIMFLLVLVLQITVTNV